MSIRPDYLSRSATASPPGNLTVPSLLPSSIPSITTFVSIINATPVKIPERSSAVSPGPAGLPRPSRGGSSRYGPDPHHHAAGWVAGSEFALDRERVGLGVLLQERGNPVQAPLSQPPVVPC